MAGIGNDVNLLLWEFFAEQGNITRVEADNGIPVEGVELGVGGQIALVKNENSGRLLFDALPEVMTLLLKLDEYLNLTPVSNVKDALAEMLNCAAEEILNT